MTNTYTTTQSFPDFNLWQKKREKNALFSFTLELTARCNNNCRHCYINLPEDDRQAQARELSLEEIKSIVNQAVNLGAVWCLITGGEPLLRQDFEEIYLYLKRQGLLVSVFTNATTITQKHIELFKNYPPRDLEVTVYGITSQTYSAVTRKPELFSAFMRGLNLLLDSNIPVNLKTVTIKANFEEFKDIAEFCRKHTRDPFRFDPLIHLRLDQDAKRNQKIRRQRLTAEQIALLERSDEARHNAMKANCDKLILKGKRGKRHPQYLRLRSRQIKLRRQSQWFVPSLLFPLAS
jgi:MoaA/NifB/PqqE/SkfB family radical SAM enzyme